MDHAWLGAPSRAPSIQSNGPSPNPGQQAKRRPEQPSGGGDRNSCDTRSGQYQLTAIELRSAGDPLTEVRGEPLMVEDWSTPILIALAGTFIAIHAWRSEQLWEDHRNDSD